MVENELNPPNRFIVEGGLEGRCVNVPHLVTAREDTESDTTGFGSQKPCGMAGIDIGLAGITMGPHPIASSCC